MVWDPQKPNIDPVDPPVDPILAQFVGKKADFWVKKRVFLKKVFLLKIIFYRFPDGLGPSKTQNWPFIAPNGPHSGVLRHFRSPRNPLGLAHKSSALFKP